MVTDRKGRTEGRGGLVRGDMATAIAIPTHPYPYLYLLYAHTHTHAPSPFPSPSRDELDSGRPRSGTSALDGEMLEYLHAEYERGKRSAPVEADVSEHTGGERGGGGVSPRLDDSRNPRRPRTHARAQTA